MTIDVVIGAAATVLSGVASGLLGRRWGREKAEKQAASSVRKLADELSGRFGWKAQQVISSATVSPEGNSTVTRQWRGITPAAGATISQFPGRFWVSTPNGILSELPSLRSTAQNREVRLNSIDYSDKGCHYQVEFEPPLDGDDEAVDVTIEASFNASVLMSKNEVEQEYRKDIFKNEFHSYDVSVPLDELLIEINLPPAISMNIRPMVFFGWSEVKNYTELKRVLRAEGGGGFAVNGNSAKLRVPDPVVGLRYAIYWILKD